MKSKILHIITSLDDGGAEAILTKLILNESDNVHVVVCLKSEGKYSEILANQGIDVVCLNMGRKIGIFRALSDLITIVRVQKPDVLQTWMYHADLIGGVIGKICGIPKIVWGIHSSGISLAELKFSTFSIVKVNSLLSYFIPNNIIYCAESSRDAHLKSFYCARKGTVILNGYDTDEFNIDCEKRLMTRASFQFLDSDIVIGMVARYAEVKNHELLLSAFSIALGKIANLRLLLVGSDMDNKNVQLVDRICELKIGGSVSLAGPTKDVCAVMNCIDVHVLSSDSEACPNVIVEALACGTRCIATDVGDCSKIITGEPVGVICKPGNMLTMSAAIVELCGRVDVHTRCIVARQHVIENFSMDRMCAGYLAIWGQALPNQS